MKTKSSEDLNRLTKARELMERVSDLLRGTQEPAIITRAGALKMSIDIVITQSKAQGHFTGDQT